MQPKSILLTACLAAFAVAGCGDDEPEVASCVGPGCPDGVDCGTDELCDFAFSDADPCANLTADACVIVIDGTTATTYAVDCPDGGTATDCGSSLCSVDTSSIAACAS